MPMNFEQFGTREDDVALAYLYITQGDTATGQIDWNDDGVATDFTSCEAYLVIKDVSLSGEVLSFASTGASTGIVLGGTAGTMRFEKAATVIAAVPAGQYVYDLKVTGADDSTRTYAAGPCYIIGQVGS